MYWFFALLLALPLAQGKDLSRIGDQTVPLNCPVSNKYTGQIYENYTRAFPTREQSFEFSPEYVNVSFYFIN